VKVIQVNYSDINGGAARAAYRIHHALRDADIDSTMMVDSATSGDWTVQGPATKFRKGLAIIRPSLASSVFKPVFKTGNPIIHSPAMLSSGLGTVLNNSDADVLHLHWVQAEMMSISEIGQLRKPIVWTLHDMWAFCGAEHYSEEFRWREGYHKFNRPNYESGFDLNLWTWNRKRKQWKKPIQIITPSNWLAKCVSESALMKGWPVSVIANPIDTNYWRPMDKALSREILGLPKDVPLILFGAIGGAKDPRKGFDLLQGALKHLQGEIAELQLVVFGQHIPKRPLDLGFQTHYTGHLHDNLSLRALYSAADAFVLPSRQDNLPNTGVEAMACGTPVVAFDTCGMPDIVIHKQTGYLARAFDIVDLAQGILWTIKNSYIVNEETGKEKIKMDIRKNARKKAVDFFSNHVIASQYKKIYHDIN
jgi:glycosyltransferase involved in cell wall biosynthesis